METRGCKATEASCGTVLSKLSLFYISAVLVTGIIIIKCSLGNRQSDNLGKKLDDYDMLVQSSSVSIC